MSRYTIHVKHDTKHRTWKRLSVTALSPQALDGDAYAAQYAADHQMNPDQIAWRVVEIDSSSVGSSDLGFIRVIQQRPSAAADNRPAATV